jgi:hypothetical protein
VSQYLDLFRKELTDVNLLDKLANVYSAYEGGFPLNNKPQNKAFEKEGLKIIKIQTCVERGENVSSSMHKWYWKLQSSLPYFQVKRS